MSRRNTDQTYEYKNVKVPAAWPKKQEKIINKLAEQGWELVQIRAGGGWTKSTAVLRRPVTR